MNLLLHDRPTMGADGRHPAAGPGRLITVAIGAVGASAVMTQLAMMRELLGAFSGNELVFGICLGNWLLLTGLGAWLGGFLACRSGIRTFIAGLTTVAVIPLFQIVAVRVLRIPVFGAGTAVDVGSTVLGSFAVLLPFCLVSGALLTLAAARPADPDRSAGPEKAAGAAASGPAVTLRRVYLADTLGGAAGGVLFSFVLVRWLDHFALLTVPAFVLLALAGLLSWRHRAWFLLETAGIVAAGLAVHLALVNADFVSTALQHPDEVIAFRGNSPYGRLIVGQRAGLLTFYENGVPLPVTENTGQVEEAVLYGLSQRPGARRILLIGGGVAGDARELLRADPGARLTYVELDPAVIAAGRRLLPGNLDDPRIHTVATDGRRFVRRTAERFDLVITDLPDPSTAQLNRFFTLQFFREVRRVLAPGGVLAFGFARYANYVSPPLGRMLACAHRTLALAFPHVLLIPGGRVYFLASDGPLTLDIAGPLARSGLRPLLVNRHYLGATLAPDRLADLARAVAQPAAINTDYDPVLYYYHLRHWLNQFTAHGEFPGGILGLALAAYLFSLGPAARVIFAAGFAASGLEVVILLVFQILYGSLYRQVGLIVAVFMVGLAVGAAWARRRPTAASPAPVLAALAGAIALYAAALPALLRLPAGLDLLSGTARAGQAFVLLLTLGLAGLVGAQFPIAGAAVRGRTAAIAARLFGADLAGAALGALLVSALLIPLLGVTAVCLLTAGINAAAAILAWRSAAA